MLLDMLKEDPNDPFLKYALGLEYIQKDLLDDAEKVFVELRSKHPEYLPLYYQFGQLLEKRERFDEAIAVYKAGEALASEQRDLKTRSELQEALWELEDE